MAQLMIYGTGYTGRLAAEHASSIRLDFICAGRSEKAVKDLASKLNVQHRTFSIETASEIDSALTNIRVLLNCAGPFAHTAKPFIDACIRNKVHYLDISAELNSYLYAEERSEDASQANTMLLPGCGGSVAKLGGLVHQALKDVPSPISIAIALHVSGAMSRGSALSAAEGLTVQCLQRRDQELVQQDATATRKFDFDDAKGAVDCFPITLPDLITIRKATGVPNIRTFVHAADDVFPKGEGMSLPDGPTVEQREKSPYHAAVDVTGLHGVIRRAVLHTVNGYTFTAVASVEAAKRALGGETMSGFQTPVAVFGDGLLGMVPGSRISFI